MKDDDKRPTKGSELSPELSLRTKLKLRSLEDKIHAVIIVRTQMENVLQN